jgi:hypothetical protein
MALHPFSLDAHEVQQSLRSVLDGRQSFHRSTPACMMFLDSSEDSPERFKAL